MKTKLLMSMLALAAGMIAQATEVDAAARRLVGIETAKLAARSLPPEVPVYGSVLSPAPVIDLYRQIELANAALEISKQTSSRVENLFASGELVARKDVEAARAQVVRDQAAIQSVEDRLILEWGPRFSKLSPETRSKLLKDLLAGKQAIVRLAVSRGENLESVPVAARLHAFGRETKPIRCTGLTPAPAVDAAFQAPAFVGLIDIPNAPLAIGLTLAGSLELEGEPCAGKFIPRGAVIFYLGKAWIYQQEAGDDFKRVEVPIDTPIEGGWFVANDMLKDHPAVTKGAQAILSKETLGTVEEE